MKSRSWLVVESAARLIGTPFRLHGRDPVTGLDCVGLVETCLKEAGCSVQLPTGYRLRSSSAESWLRRASLPDLEASNLAKSRGDIALIAPSSAQLHLVVISDFVGGEPTEIIHAHAQLRRVVRQQLTMPLNPVASWHLP